MKYLYFFVAVVNRPWGASPINGLIAMDYPIEKDPSAWLEQASRQIKALMSQPEPIVITNYQFIKILE